MNVHLANSSVARRQSAGFCNRQLLPLKTGSTSLAATVAAAAAVAETAAAAAAACYAAFQWLQPLQGPEVSLLSLVYQRPSHLGIRDDVGCLC